MVVLTAEQIKQWDKFTMQREPVTSIDLMERAATVAFHWIYKLLQRDAIQEVVVCCGTGNNGGDGLVIARLLAQHGLRIRVFILPAEKHSQEFVTNLHRLQQTTVSISIIENPAVLDFSFAGCLVIDALFGTGLARPLQGIAADMVTHINQFKSNVVVAIDLPSGLYADMPNAPDDVIVNADYTLSFQSVKPCLLMPEAAPFCGEWHVLDIGLHPDFPLLQSAYGTLVENNSPFIVTPQYQAFAHKGIRGTCLLYNAEAGYAGAAILAAGAALRSGAGLVVMYGAAAANLILPTQCPELVCLDDAGFFWQHEVYAEKVKAVGLGFGWSATNEDAQKKLHETLCHFAGPLLLDAGALRMMANHSHWWGKRKQNAFTVITPHIGEFDALAGRSSNHYERIEKARLLAAQWNVVIVLKGRYTAIVTPGGQLYFNTTGNHGMAKGGSGDVLSGLITGLLAQPFAPLQAVLLGVYLHGLAGDLAARALGKQSMQPSDIINHLSYAWGKLQ